MLLTKPLHTFLNANRTPYIHTLLLVTPTGKLLSSSSSVPASTLRAQATYACSIWALYKPLIATGTLTSALPIPSQSRNDDNSDEEDDEEDNENIPDAAHRSADPDVSSITIQLEEGIMIIRALKCSLLFVVIGPAPPAPSAASSASLQGLRHDLSYLSVSSAGAPASSGAASTEKRLGNASYTSLNGLRSSATSLAGSVTGGGGGVGGSLKIVKKQAEELGKWLDGELEGFTLSSGL